MDDLELDRELQAALDVTPSPEFVARVRGAVANQRGGFLAGGWSVPAGLGCATFAAVVLAVAPWNVSDQPQPGVDAISLAPSVGQQELVNRQPKERPREPKAPPVVRLKPLVAPADETTQIPEVLISQADKRAFEEFVAAIQRHHFTATFEEAPSSAPLVLTDVTVSPIAIEPLDGWPSTNVSTVHN
jgi:hypothetical protein